MSSTIEELIERYVERPPARATVPHLTPARRMPEVGSLQRMAVVPTIRSIDEGKRTITFVSSDETVDRFGDRILVCGWETDAYMANPIVLFAHRSDQPPVGRTVQIWKEAAPKPALVQVVEFADKAAYEFADTIYQLYKGGFMKAVSVGFKPTKKPNRILDDAGEWTGGYEFVGQSLLELSTVPVPANPSALARDSAGKFFSTAPDEELDPKRLLRELEIWDLRLCVDRLEVAVLRKMLEAAIARSGGNGAPPNENETGREECRPTEIETFDQLVAALTRPARN